MNNWYNRIGMLGILLIGLISQYIVSQSTSQFLFEFPQQITDAFVDKGSPAIVIDEQGNIIVAWTQYSTTYQEYGIYAAYFDYQANTWTDPKRISSLAFYIYTSPEMAIDGNGNVLVTWFVTTSSSPSSNNVYTARFDASAGWNNGWEQETLLYTGHIERPLSVAMDNLGNGMVAWVDIDSGIYASKYDIDTFTWQTPNNLDTEGSGVIVAFDGLGNAIVIWRKSSSLFTSRYTPGQSWPQGWTTSVEIANNVDDDDNNSIDTSKALQGSKAGNAMVIYQGPLSTSVEAIFYDNTIGFTTGGWQTPQTISPSSSFGYASLSVGMDENSNATALWLQESEVFSTFATNFDFTSKTWGTPTLISSDSQNVWAPQLVVDKYGNALATWHRVDYVDTDRNLVIQANQNQDNGSWYPAHDISLECSNGVFPNVAMNNNGMGAIAWSLSTSAELFVARTIQLPTLVAQWINLGTASAISMSASADGTLYLDIISQGIVYTFVHYPGTSPSAWVKLQVSPNDMYAYEIEGATDVYGNHATIWTATTRTTTRGTSERTAYLTTRTATTRTLGATSTTITTTLSDPGQDARAPHVRIQNTTTTTTFRDSIDEFNNLFSFLDLNTRNVFTGTTTTTTTRRGSGTRAPSGLIPVSPEGSFSTTTYIPGSAAAILTTWLITDTITDITNVQANYQLRPDYIPSGERNISPSNVDISSTVTPAIFVDSLGSCLFAWIETTTYDSHLLQVTSFRMSGTNQQWATFIPSIETLVSLDASNQINSLFFTYDNSYNAILTVGTDSGPLHFFYNQKTFTWSTISPTSRTLKSLNLILDNMLLTDTQATLSAIASGYQNAHGIKITTRTTTTTTTRKPSTRNFRTNTTTTTEVEQSQFNGFSIDTSDTITTTVEGTVTAISAATNWQGNIQGVATTRTTRTTTTRYNSDEDETVEDILEVLLNQPELPQPLQPANVQAYQTLHRFPRNADLVNVITWQTAATQSNLPVAANYLIFLAPNLSTPVETIPANGTLYYADHNKKPCVTYTYYLFAVDSQGTLSEPVIITLP